LLHDELQIINVEDIVDVLNIVISAQCAHKRRTVWDNRLKRELKRLEVWLKSKQKELDGG